jgi:YD repeat-containing protein
MPDATNVETALRAATDHPLDGALTETTPIGTVTYTYDTSGRRATMAVWGQSTTSYAYDNADRLPSITQVTNVVTFRATMAVPGQATITYGYDHADRLTAITQGSNVVALDYDDADRRTKLTYPSGTFTEYAYDNASRLTGMTYKHAANILGTLAYGYDGAGQ